MTLRDILTQVVNGVLNLTLKDCITLTLAAYGAGLSSYLAWFDRRPRLRLTASVNFVIGQGVDATDKPILTCTIRNTGRVPVTIDTYHFQLLGRGVGPWRTKSRHFFCPNSVMDAVTFPHELAAGKRCSLGVWAKHFAELCEQDGVDRITLRPVCVDQTGTKHSGARRVFTNSEFTEPYQCKPDEPARGARRWWPLARAARDDAATSRPQ